MSEVKCDDCRKPMNPCDRRTWCEHANARYEAALAKYGRLYAPLLESIRRSQILTAEDYAVTINCRG